MCTYAIPPANTHPPVAESISATSLSISGMRAEPFTITQCTTFSGNVGNCTSSLFQIRNVTISGLTGTSVSSRIATMKCAAVKCPFITIENVDVRNVTTDAPVTTYSCSNVRNYTGFTC